MYCGQLGLAVCVPLCRSLGLAKTDEGDPDGDGLNCRNDLHFIGGERDRLQAHKTLPQTKGSIRGKKQEIILAIVPLCCQK